MAAPWDDPNYNWLVPNDVHNSPAQLAHGNPWSPAGWFPKAADFRLGIYNQLYGPNGMNPEQAFRGQAEAARWNAGNISAALTRRAQLAGEAAGVTPEQKAWLAVRGQGGGQESDLLMKALMDIMNQRSAYAQRLQLGTIGLSQDQPDQSGGGNPLNALLGIGGAALGGWLAPGGWFAGAH